MVGAWICIWVCGIWLLDWRLCRNGRGGMVAIWGICWIWVVGVVWIPLCVEDGQKLWIDGVVQCVCAFAIACRAHRLCKLWIWGLFVRPRILWCQLLNWREFGNIWRYWEWEVGENVWSGVCGSISCSQVRICVVWVQFGIWSLMLSGLNTYRSMGS